MTHNKRQLPLLDTSVLNELREELQNDETIWKAFVRNYHTYLPSRIERLRLNPARGQPGKCQGRST